MGDWEQEWAVRDQSRPVQNSTGSLVLRETSRPHHRKPAGYHLPTAVMAGHDGGEGRQSSCTPAMVEKGVASEGASGGRVRAGLSAYDSCPITASMRFFMVERSKGLMM
jgi:hypothetical protein